MDSRLRGNDGMGLHKLLADFFVCVSYIRMVILVFWEIRIAFASFNLDCRLFYIIFWLLDRFSRDITFRHDLQIFSADDDAVVRRLSVYIIHKVGLITRTENLSISKIPSHVAV